MHLILGFTLQVRKKCAAYVSLFHVYPRPCSSNLVALDHAA